MKKFIIGSVWHTVLGIKANDHTAGKTLTVRDIFMVVANNGTTITVVPVGVLKNTSKTKLGIGMLLDVKPNVTYVAYPDRCFEVSLNDLIRQSKLFLNYVGTSSAEERRMIAATRSAFAEYDRHPQQQQVDTHTFSRESYAAVVYRKIFSKKFDGYYKNNPKALTKEDLPEAIQQVISALGAPDGFVDTDDLVMYIKEGVDDAFQKRIDEAEVIDIADYLMDSTSPRRPNTHANRRRRVAYPNAAKR